MITIDFPPSTIPHMSEIVYFTAPIPIELLSELTWLEDNGEILVAIHCDDGVVLVKKYNKTPSVKIQPK